MAVPKELNTLAQVAFVIDETELKITFANQCIKAQESLINKLKDEIQRQKEICKSKKNENFKLEAEIRNAELEIENSRISYTATLTNNTEKKKELLLTKEKKDTISARIEKGEKKYEALWIQCKERYERIPLVKTLVANKNKLVELKTAIDVLDVETTNIELTIKTKKEEIADKDRKQIVLLAEFIVQELPAAVKTIEEKLATIKTLNKEIDEITKEVEAKEAKVVNDKAAIAAKITEAENEITTKDTWTIDNTLMIPKLQLPSVDMDLHVKLDINKMTLHTSPMKKTISFTELEKNSVSKTKPDEMLKDNYISCYFNNAATDEDDAKKEDSTVNYSKKKLINIIEDIKIDDNETYRLVADTNIDQFQEVDVITATRKAQEFIKSAASQKSQTMEIEEVDEVHTTGGSQQFLNPPTQFLDDSQIEPITEATMQHSQHEVQAEVHVDAAKTSESHYLSQSQVDKKKVSFDLFPTTLNESDAVIEVDKQEEGTPNTTVTSQLDLSDVTDDNYLAIKDMILKKKQQLDLSPQFVYTKNKNNLQKQNEEQVVISKFFETDKGSGDISTTENKEGNNEKEQKLELEQENKIPKEKVVDMDVDNAVSGPEGHSLDKPVAGLLFTHGPQGVTDLDISMSTTGYEEGDPDFPTCLDSSLLLSPKADISPMSGNSEVGSQDLPSFLTGFRKGGLSFFKQNPADTNPDTSKPQNSDNNFNFNFGADDKKRKGGLFSFFR